MNGKLRRTSLVPYTLSGLEPVGGGSRDRPSFSRTCLGTNLVGVLWRGFFYTSHPRADFIIASRREEVYRAIWRQLFRSGNWDVLQLCQLPAGSKTLDTLPHLAASDGCPTGVWLSGASPYLSLDTTWEQYFGGLVTKHRSDLRNRFKRLKQVGPVELEVLISEAGLEEALKTGLQLKAAASKGTAGAVERGWLLLNFLRVGSHQVAFDYSPCNRDTIYVLKFEYDPAYSPYSPYNLLLTLVLEKAYAQGVTEYDFLGLAQEWKLSWNSQSVPHYWLFVFPPSPRGRFLHWIKLRLIPLLKREDLLGRGTGFCTSRDDTARTPCTFHRGPD
jgi:hypothetical protein